MRTEELWEEKVNSYLLGKLTEEEAARFEAEVFDDDADYERFQAAQNDLLDAYARGALSPADRELFERHTLASPFLRRRAAFAEALHDAVQNSAFSRDASRDAVAVEPVSPEQVSPENKTTTAWPAKLKAMFSPLVFRPLAAAALLLLIAGGVYLWWEISRLRHEVADTRARLSEETRQAVQDRRRAEQLAEQLRQEQQRRAQLETDLAARPTPEPPLSVAAVLSFILSPAGFRDGAGPQRLTIPPPIKTLRLQLRVPDGLPQQTYRIEIETIDEQKVWTRNGLRATSTAGGQRVTAQLPASALPGGDYIVKLKADGDAQQEVADYPLRVVKE